MKLERILVRKVFDEDPDTSYLTKKRRKDLEAGKFEYIYMYAEAELWNEKSYLGLDLGHDVYDMREMIDYSDDLYEKTKQHYGYSQSYSGVD